jgi:voltage-gated potassium channel
MRHHPARAYLRYFLGVAMAERRIEAKGHVIVCGFGVVGQKVVDSLVEHNIDFVVVDTSPEVMKKVNELGYKAIEGDATSSKVLKSAGIASAKAIAITMDDDAKNLFAVLTSRDLNKKIFIATRSNDDFLREKLIDAGADYIVMPQKTASREIVKELIK